MLEAVMAVLAPAVPVSALLSLGAAVYSLAHAKSEREQLREAELAILAEDDAETKLLAERK